MTAMLLRLFGLVVAGGGTLLLIVSARPLLRYRRHFRRHGLPSNLNWRAELIVMGGGFIALVLGLALYSR